MKFPRTKEIKNRRRRDKYDIICSQLIISRESGIRLIGFQPNLMANYKYVSGLVLQTF